MLDDFIRAHRDTIIARAQACAAARGTLTSAPPDAKDGVPDFLDQLADALRLARSTDAIDHDEIASSSSRHGSDQYRSGHTIGDVVHGYGDVCQIITQLCMEVDAPISALEFRLLNLCLDDAIAGAVTEYARQQQRSLASEGTERIGALSHELRNYLGAARLAFDSIASGRVAVSGSTGALLNRSLAGLQDLLDRSLLTVRLGASVQHRELLAATDLISDVETSAALQAAQRDVHFSARAIPRDVMIEGDRQLLVAALSNLLQNAIKFTRRSSHVTLGVRATADRVFFDVEDECGGLPPGRLEGLFAPFEQRSPDRTGMGLGLSISRDAAHANGGEVTARDLPGKGCVFTLDLPRSARATRGHSMSPA